MALTGKLMKVASSGGGVTPQPGANDTSFAWKTTQVSPSRCMIASRAADYPIGWTIGLAAHSWGCADASGLAGLTPPPILGRPSPDWPQPGQLVGKLPRALILDLTWANLAAHAQQAASGGYDFPADWASANSAMSALGTKLAKAGILAVASGALSPWGSGAMDWIGCGTPWFKTTSFASEVPSEGLNYYSGGTSTPNRIYVGPTGDPGGWFFGETLYATLSDKDTTSIAPDGSQVIFFPYGYLKLTPGVPVIRTFGTRPAKLASDVAWAKACSKQYKRVAWRGLGLIEADVDSDTCTAAAAQAKSAGIDATWEGYNLASGSSATYLLWAANKIVSYATQFFGL